MAMPVGLMRKTGNGELTNGRGKRIDWEEMEEEAEKSQLG